MYSEVICSYNTFHLILFCLGKKIRSNVHGSDVVLTIADVLQYLTGAANIPAEGFESQPQINFDHSPLSVGRYPTVTTCTCTYTLPVWEGLLNENKANELYFDAVIGSRIFCNV